MDSDRVYRCSGVVQGKVQGVFFRVESRRRAIALGIGGWVRNCPDGSVEFELQGTESQLSAMERWLSVGPSLARVDQLTLHSKVLAEAGTQQEPEGRGFSITRY